jgi:type II secretory pathway component PulC
VRLEFRNPANALARLGLKNGEVVLSLNGEPIRTPEELYNSYLILRNTPSVDFEVLRGGRPTSVRYDFPEGDPG